MGERKRIEFIDCTRSICMLWIIGIWHLAGYIKGQPNINNYITSTITNGVLATFMFLSGYFMGRNSIHSFNDVLTFWKKRVLRIYPLFLLSAISFLVLHYCFSIDYINSISQFFHSILGVAAFIGDSAQTIWFISILVFFYFVSPLVLSINSNTYRAVVILLLYGFFFIINLLNPDMDLRLFLYYPFYMMGLFLRSKGFGFNEKIQPPYIITACVAETLLIFFTYDANNIFIKTICSIPIVFIAIEIGKLCTKIKWVVSVMSHISYAGLVAYLFHRQLLGFLQTIFGKFNIYFAYIIILPLVFLISYYIQILFDRIMLTATTRKNRRHSCG